ncbi:MAG: hypothetical protein A3F11_02155 [Gammaproteobacteria bacterium RIFCSPHIGHO2_12_FULL_37_14]|nr:MAG: hypothetical protein A3F11_02155 [Gammaproteobacteria bacterium RIFCSPHIGHO2_12_FULL_37_14]
MININQLDNTVALSSGKQITEITNILKNCFNITHYCYIKSFNDGTHFLLSNDSPWIEKFYLNFYEYGAFHKNEVIYQSGTTLWSTVPDQTTFKICREYFNIDHGITLIEKQPDYCEFHCFGSTKDNHQVIDFYINNIDILNQFNMYFKEKAKDLIKDAHADRYILPACNLVQPNQSDYNNSKDLEQKRECFLQITQSQQRRLIGVYSHINLSRRQLDCLSLITLGKSAKEIGRIFNISFRTVETYIEIIKSKLGVKNKAELIAMSLKYNPHYCKYSQYLE